MTLNIDQIIEPNSYHYNRTLRGVTIYGKGRVIQRYLARNGWQIILHDVENRRAITLRPAHILKPVRVRK